MGRSKLMPGTGDVGDMKYWPRVALTAAASVDPVIKRHAKLVENNVRL